MSANTLIKLVGMDPSMNNWGLAGGLYNPATGQLSISGLGVTQPALPEGKQTRVNSSDLARAEQLFAGAINAAREAQAVFIEVPVGSQSARAMASYGICVGVLGALRASGIPFFEVTATEVKLAGPGHKTASKTEMINWAMDLHPLADWPLHNGKISAAKAEHMADAIAAMYAGLKLPAFQQFLSMRTNLLSTGKL